MHTINTADPNLQELLGIFGETLLPGSLYMATSSNPSGQKFVKVTLLSLANSVSSLLLDKLLSTVFRTNTFAARFIKTLASCVLTPCIFALFDPKTLNSKSSAKQAKRNVTVVGLKILRAAGQELLNPSWAKAVDLLFKYLLLPLSYANMVKPAKIKKSFKYRSKSDWQVEIRNTRNSSAGFAASLSLVIYGLHQMYSGNMKLANTLLRSALPGLRYSLESSKKYQELEFLNQIVKGFIAGAATEGLALAIPAGKKSLAGLGKEIFRPELVKIFSELSQYSIITSISDLFDKVVYRAGSNVIQQVLFNEKFKRRELFDASLRGIGDTITLGLLKKLTRFKIKLSNGIFVRLTHYTDEEYKRFWSYSFWKRHIWMQINTRDAKGYPLFQHLKLTLNNLFHFGLNDLTSEAIVAIWNGSPKEHFKKWSADLKSSLLFRLTIAFAATGQTLENYKEIRARILLQAKHYKGYYKEVINLGYSDAMKRFGTEENYRNELNRVAQEASNVLGHPIEVDSLPPLSAAFPLDAIQVPLIENLGNN